MLLDSSIQDHEIRNIFVVSVLLLLPECSTGYFENTDGSLCYDVSTEAVTWYAARDTCQSQGKQLAEPRTLEDDNKIQTIASTTGAALWLGLTCMKGGFMFRYVTDNVPTELRRWRDGDPDRTCPPEDCAALSRVSGQVMDRNCLEHHLYVCEKAAHPPPSASCGPGGWLQHQGKCYHAVYTPVSWNAAESDCAKQGSKLARLENDAIRGFVHSLLTLEGLYWVDGTDWAQEGRWTWQDGDPISWFPWENGEPNDASRECIVMTPGGWLNVACNMSDVTYRYLCQAAASSLRSDSSATTVTSHPPSDAYGGFLSWAVTSAEVSRQETQLVRSLLECASACVTVNWCDAIAVKACDSAPCGRKSCLLMSTSTGGEVVALSQAKVMRRHSDNGEEDPQEVLPA